MDGIVSISPQEFIELLWPLGKLFGARWDNITRIRYEARFESQADAAIEALVSEGDRFDCDSISEQVCRVVFERQVQIIALARYAMFTGRTVWDELPEGLTPSEKRRALMKRFLIRTKLPLPPQRPRPAADSFLVHSTTVH